MEKLVLVCDDDRSILEVTRAILEDRNIKVVCAVDCDDIVNKARQHKPDLILMDLWIPNSGGEKATALLKQNPETASIPVILFSAVNNLENIAEKCGADGYINKPFELEEMVEIIESHLGQDKELFTL
jgi:CheY-like chemotaxis protein